MEVGMEGMENRCLYNPHPHSSFACVSRVCVYLKRFVLFDGKKVDRLTQRRHQLFCFLVLSIACPDAHLQSASICFETILCCARLSYFVKAVNRTLVFNSPSIEKQNKNKTRFVFEVTVLGLQSLDCG